MRHGKAEKDSPSGHDIDRPLTSRGERDVPAIARWLVEHDYRPELIVSSPAARARQTASLAAAEMRYPEAGVELMKDVYNASQGGLLSVLAKCAPGKTPVMLVGHNPGMEELAIYLSGGEGLPEDDNGMPTSAVTVLELPDSWSKLKRGSGKVIAHMRPRWLTDK